MSEVPLQGKRALARHTRFHTHPVDYRGTSLMRNSPLPYDRNRNLGMVLL